MGIPSTATKTLPRYRKRFDSLMIPPKLPAATLSSRLSAIRAMREQQEHSEQRGDLPATLASRTRPDFDQNDVTAIMRAWDPSGRPQSVPRPKDVRSLASLVLLVCAFGGASALLTWAMLRPGTPRMSYQAPTAATQPVARAPQSLPDQRGSFNEAFRLKTPATTLDALSSLQASQEPRAEGGNVPAQAQLQATESGEPTRQVEPATASVPLSARPQSSQRASTQTGAALVSGPGNQAEANEPIRWAESSVPPSPPPQSSQGLDTQTAPAPVTGPGLQEANDPTRQVGPASAIVAASPLPPSQGAGTQTVAAPVSRPDHQEDLNEPPRLFESGTVSVPPSSPPEPSPRASTQIGAAPAPGTKAESNELPRQIGSSTVAPASEPQPAPAQGSSTALPLDSQEITTLIDRGTAFLKKGDLASARLLLRRAAEARSASAALILGSTFDPLIVQKSGVIGIELDVARARQWYERAAELGSDDASQRLANLKNQ